MENSSCCHSRSTPRSDTERQKLIHRLNRIEGQIRGLRRMVESDGYCTDILTQSAAAGAALNAFNRALIDGHLRGCVARDLQDGQDDAIDDLSAALQKLMR